VLVIAENFVVAARVGRDPGGQGIHLTRQHGKAFAQGGPSWPHAALPGQRQQTFAYHVGYRHTLGAGELLGQVLNVRIIDNDTHNPILFPMMIIDISQG
jgi:hypothetical protein